MPDTRNDLIAAALLRLRACGGTGSTDKPAAKQRAAISIQPSVTGGHLEVDSRQLHVNPK
ncbi:MULTISPECIES: hypothetical protein [unclassified Streptomyces]|uniref:hypothetical protein n=1 Tax=unclassified Streptomyces TaxID=2593676 RepID=UPI003D92B6D2